MRIEPMLAQKGTKFKKPACHYLCFDWIFHLINNKFNTSMIAKLIFCLRTLSFVAMLYWVTIVICIFQLFSLLANRSIRRKCVRICISAYGAMLVMLNRIFHSDMKLVLSGDHDDITPTSFTVLIANHQIYTDWWYIWIFGHLKGNRGIKYAMMKDLEKVPFLGWSSSMVRNYNSI
jgi:1-acyl-sn-glycerol-3-phosphate acyltransferase